VKTGTGLRRLSSGGKGDLREVGSTSSYGKKYAGRKYYSLCRKTRRLLLGMETRQEEELFHLRLKEKKRAEK